MRISDWSSDVCSSDRFELVAIDVTSEHAEIELLRRSMENLRLIVEYNPQLPWIADAEGRIIDFTDRWLESSGLDRKSVVSGKSGSVRVDLGGRGIIKKNTHI